VCDAAGIRWTDRDVDAVSADRLVPQELRFGGDGRGGLLSAASSQGLTAVDQSRRKESDAGFQASPRNPQPRGHD
jgi:hypothetical protein